MNQLANHTGSVTSAAYVTLISSTGIPFANIFATDTTGQMLKLAVGAAGHEVDICQLPVGGSLLIPMPSLATVPVGSRLSIRAIGTSASTGYTAVTLLS